MKTLSGEGSLSSEASSTTRVLRLVEATQPRAVLLPRAAPAVEAGKHDIPHGAFENAMRVSQSIIQTRALFQLDFV